MKTFPRIFFLPEPCAWKCQIFGNPWGLVLDFDSRFESKSAILEGVEYESSNCISGIYHSQVFH